MINFLNWIKDQRGRDPDAWAAYRAGITVFEATDFFRPCYPEWLREGMSADSTAWRTDDPALKAQHVFRGNILIGAYEQWRVDAFFEVALDFNPGALVKDLRISCHDEVGTRPMESDMPARVVRCVISGRRSTGCLISTRRCSRASS